MRVEVRYAHHTRHLHVHEAFWVDGSEESLFATVSYRPSIHMTSIEVESVNGDEVEYMVEGYPAGAASLLLLQALAESGRVRHVQMTGDAQPQLF